MNNPATLPGPGREYHPVLAVGRYVKYRIVCLASPDYTGYMSKTPSKNTYTDLVFQADRGFVNSTRYGRQVWFICQTRKAHVCCFCGNPITPRSLALRPFTDTNNRRDRICRSCIIKHDETKQKASMYLSSAYSNLYSPERNT